MLDLKSATKGLTDTEIREFINSMTLKYFDAIIRRQEDEPNETAKKETKV